MKISFAHSLQGRPISDWEPLENHLFNVSHLAGDFSFAFDSRDWGCLAGLWHDLGKYSREFQNYLLKENGYEAHLEEVCGIGKVDHSTAGAQHADSAGKKAGGIVLSYCIAGHHGGLGNGSDFSGDGSRLNKEIKEWKSYAPRELLNQPFPKPPAWLRGGDKPLSDEHLKVFRQSFWCRMLFSALVDADFLATESFMSPAQAAAREHPEFPAMKDLLKDVLDFIGRCASDARCASEVARHRAEVLAACLKKSELPPGFFSLSVPTGGGKTLSSLAFALSHAARHDLRRIIYAIPFTSIIEQNADVFRKALGAHADVVLEQHSNLEPEKMTPWSRLAGENWDAPLVVTTNVQLLESLFANRTSRCRKLHRIARSVIILDEAQTLPVHLLRPCLAALRELVESYGCTVVMCTATQPALDYREDFPIGISGVREIMDDAPRLYAGMRRVDASYAGSIPDAELSERLAQCPQALCIVNTRRHAAKIFDMLKHLPHAIHLSALMCPNHRSEVIANVRRKLKEGQPCLVISTQLIEAGVDVDFPVVYRAMAGIDSVAQAAGRCNREGRLSRGQVYLFDAEILPPVGDQRKAADTTKEKVIGQYEDILSLPAVREYFEHYYWKRAGHHQWDEPEVMDCFKQGTHWNFRDAADRFVMIPDHGGKSVIIPWGDSGQKLCQQIVTAGKDALLPPDVFRRAQRLIVQIHERDWLPLVQSGAIVLYGPGESLPVLMNADMYDARLGLQVGGPGGMSPTMLMY